MSDCLSTTVARGRSMTIQPDTPSVRERQLALELREAGSARNCRAARLPASWAGPRPRCPGSRPGRIGISPTDLDRLLELYRVPDEQAPYLRRLAPAPRTRGWWDAYADSLSAGYSGLLRLEAGSQALSCYCAVVPHPRLMTPEYVRQVVLATWQAPSAQEADRRVRICVRRQAVIQPRDPHPGLTLKPVIDEAVLRRSAAPPTSPDGDTIMLGQLDRLITVAGWPNVTIQVLPYTAGIPPVSAGSFSVLESRATGAPDRRLPRETEPESSSSTQHLRSIGTQGISSCSPRSPYRRTNPPNSSIPSRTNSGTTPPPVHSETEIHHSPGGRSLGCITG